MTHDPNMPSDGEGSCTSPGAAPSADFIHAISEFFDTDPSDLLVELGYYQRSTEDAETRTLVDMAAQQE